LLVGITGKKRSGKDTAATFLVNELGYQRAAFADKLKKAANTIFGFIDLSDDAKEIEVDCKVYAPDIGDALRELGFKIEEMANVSGNLFDVYEEYIERFTGTGFIAKISPRVAYQLLGTEFGRMYDEKFWINQIDISFPNTVITDVRFDNEAKFIKDNGGKIILIENPFVEENDTSKHASEAGVDRRYIDAVIVNDDSLNEFKYKTMLIMRGISK
jgi:hypothetical protein